jgi:hypothetical protein
MARSPKAVQAVEAPEPDPGTFHSVIKVDLEPLPEPEPEPVFRICGNCAHWRPRPNWPAIGECMPSRAGGPQPIVTTDWQGCSFHKPKHP